MAAFLGEGSCHFLIEVKLAAPAHGILIKKGEFISFLFVIGRMSELLIEDTVIRDQEKSGRLTVKASDRRKPVIL